MSLLQFITAVPWDVRRGSGCYVGTRTLVKALRQLRIEVGLVAPRIVTPMYTATRVLFNESLRWRHFVGDATAVEQDHRTVKHRVRALQGFRTSYSARRTIQGIETVQMIRKGQVRWLAKATSPGRLRSSTVSSVSPQQHNRCN